jgi:hypothetical protein
MNTDGTTEKRAEASETKSLGPLVGCTLYYETGQKCKIKNINNYWRLYTISMNMF